MKHYEVEPAHRIWGEILAKKAKQNRDKVYVHFKDRSQSYQELEENANRLANGYLSLGVKKGDRVSIMMPNCLEFLYHWFAVAKIGAVDNPINVAYKGDSLRHVIANSASRFIVIHQQYLDRLAFIQEKLSEIAAVIVFPLEGCRQKIKFPVHDFASLLENDAALSVDPQIKPSDPLQIIYTSGTTGLSKGVVLSHSCIYHYATDQIKLQCLDENTRCYNCLPLFHQNHRFTATYTMLLDGTYAMGERYSARAFWGEIRKYRANHFHFLGGMMYMMYNQSPKSDDADNPAVTAFGGPIALDIAESFEKRFGVELFCGCYGLTEASSITSLTFDEARELKKQRKWAQAVGLGRVQKEIYEVRVVDDHDEEVPNGQPGEIIARPSRPYAMMSEYINNPQATLSVMNNLWFHTGDLVQKDEDGFLHFVDRKKDYLRRRGENISSFEVEKVINAHASVADSAVVSAKSEIMEDEIRAFIQLKVGSPLTPEELMAWCDARMPYFMVPRFVDFVSDFPRSPVGRIEKYKLRDETLEKSWDREKAGYVLNR